MRRQFVWGAVTGTLILVFLTLSWHSAAWFGLIWLPLLTLGFLDYFQKRHTVRRNFPIIGHFRYLLEAVRPEINQYFIESATDGRPFSREQRSVVYQRSKRELDTLPFGTRLNVYEIGYEWVDHSLAPAHVVPQTLRLTVGGPQCSRPYSASIFNISAMSFGSLSKNAILALNGGAKIGNFAHDTGEGGLTPYHLEPGGDLIWEIGTAYFGCRTKSGAFCAEKFLDKSRLPAVKMCEVKLSQGAKPGMGGLLPAAKVTPEIAAIRGVELGHDIVSPPAHSSFSTPLELLAFLQRLRELSDGKPIGFKLCIGKRREFLGICKAMMKSGIYPDFITIDGGEGGTGAAPIEFSNYVGSPMREGLIFAHNALIGFDLRKHIRLLCSSRILSGFDIISALAMGADICNSARAMMMALGCIQALRCNTNRCPTGVATQDPNLIAGLNVDDKRVRVANYHRETVNSVAEILGAMGLKHSSEIKPWHLLKRTGLAEIKNYSELYDYLEPGDLLNGKIPAAYQRPMLLSHPETFQQAPSFR